MAILTKYEGYSTDLAKAKVEKKKLETIVNKVSEQFVDHLIYWPNESYF